MKKRTYTLLASVFLLGIQTIVCQTISSKIVDKKTSEAVPYATIQLSPDKGIITNEEGIFSVTINEKETDSIHISSMGYERASIALQDAIKDSIIYIQPKAIELNEVFISNKNLTIDQIMNNVQEKLTENYSTDLSHKKLFYRQSDFNDINKINVAFKKSTIEELNKKFIDSVVSIIPRKSQYYTEVLCDFYGNFEKQKLNIIKGAELYDKSNDGSMETLSNKIETILKKNVKPNSYLKIKSGWFLSTKVQMDSIFENDDEAVVAKEKLDTTKKKNDYFFKYRKSSLKSIFNSLFFLEDAKVNFINKASKYTFELQGYTTIDNHSVYIVNFAPKRSADFKGTIYINVEDFAVIRADYQNIKNLKSINLLGFSFKDFLYKGKTIFSKGSDGKYHLKYVEKTRGNAVGVDRPLKIIEKNKFVKGKRKQNELSVGIDTNASAVSKSEVIIFDTKPLTENEYTNGSENKFIKPQYLSSYKPDFWKGYNIIEPNTAIKQFKADTQTTE